MIERLRAANGDAVIRVDGRLLASRVDPRAEARAFVDARAALVADVKTVFVLGLGSGHHVAELLGRTRARVIVLEPRADVIAANAHDFDPARLTVVPASDDALDAPPVADALANSYVVLVHPASRALAPADYQRWAARLGARDADSLANVWTRRGWAAPAHGFLPSNEPLTIHDLARFELGPDAARTRALIRALKELVK